MTQVTDQPAGVAAFQRLLASERLPAWLPRLLTTLHEGQHPDVAASWGRRVVDSVDQPPFEVVHDWQARTVVPLMLRACEPEAPETGPIEAGASEAGPSEAGPIEPASGQPAADEPATREPIGADLRRMHARAASGERFGEAEWQAAIEPVLRTLYQRAYGYAEAYATARASALAYARANDFSQSGAIEFADSYAKLSTDSNRKSYAEANAVANAAVLAAAYASGEAQAYAETYPFALAHACAHACANQATPPAGDQPATLAERRQLAYARLADGLADSLARFR